MTVYPERGQIDTLEPARSLSGHDAYCHVCWEPFYSLWISPEPPPGTCVRGALRAIDCAQAMSRAALTAFLIGARGA